LFAIVIGINKYLNQDGINLRNLGGAEADARAMANFLREELQVLPQNVNLLLNSQATRAKIVEAINFLGSNNSIKFGDPILIYYAGHGARSNNTTTAQPNHETLQRHPVFEMLAPSDISLASGPRPHITGIADYEIRHLLNEVARVKGNNIASPCDWFFQMIY
jgi:hypothetical protein